MEYRVAEFGSNRLVIESTGSHVSIKSFEPCTMTCETELALLANAVGVIMHQKMKEMPDQAKKIQKDVPKFVMDTIKANLYVNKKVMERAA